jgi:hypothetical protein
MCSDFTSTGLDDPGMDTLYMLAPHLQCFKCNVMDQLYSSQRLKYYADFNMYAMACTTTKDDCKLGPIPPAQVC